MDNLVKYNELILFKFSSFSFTQSKLPSSPELSFSDS